MPRRPWRWSSCAASACWTRHAGSAPVDDAQGVQAVASVTLRRPLRPDEIKALVTGLDFQAEFFSGRGSACA